MGVINLLINWYENYLYHNGREEGINIGGYFLVDYM